MKKLQSLHAKTVAKLDQSQRACDRAYKEADAIREKEFLENHYSVQLAKPFGLALKVSHLIPMKPFEPGPPQPAPEHSFVSPFPPCVQEDTKSKQTYVVEVIKGGHAFAWNNGSGKKDNCAIEANDVVVDIEHNDGHMVNVQHEGMEALIKHITTHAPEIVTIRFKRKGVNQPDKVKPSPSALKKVLSLSISSSGGQLAILNQRAKDANAAYLNQVMNSHAFLSRPHSSEVTALLGFHR